jgi:Fe2+ or Zn2+ uptake regulation protein
MSITPGLTKNQQIVLAILEAHGVGTHLTAYDLLLRAKKRQPGIGMATVHRAVTQLHKQGLISKVVIPGMDSATFEPAGDPHAHFCCKVCGALEDVDYALPARTLNRLASLLGARLEPEHLTLSGICRKCLSAETTGRRAAERKRVRLKR